MLPIDTLLEGSGMEIREHSYVLRNMYMNSMPRSELAEYKVLQRHQIPNYDVQRIETKSIALQTEAQCSLLYAFRIIGVKEVSLDRRS